MTDLETTVKKLMSLIGIVLLAAVGTAGTALADHRPGHAPAPTTGPTVGLSLTADTPVVRYNPFLNPPGGVATLSGRLTGMDSGGKVIVLEQNPAPLADNQFQGTGREATTDAQGNFRFTGVLVPVNTQFRAETRGAGPRTTSNTTDVKVRPRVTCGVSDATPSRDERVRFSGRVWPEHDGKPVDIQRRGRDGKFRTVKRTAARDVVGQVYSRYSVRVRVRSTGVYRVVVRPGDGDHLNGYSRNRKLRVG
jgi:hypothetical protein